MVKDNRENKVPRNSEPKWTPVPINFASPHAASFQKKKEQIINEDTPKLRKSNGLTWYDYDWLLIFIHTVLRNAPGYAFRNKIEKHTSKEICNFMQINTRFWRFRLRNVQTRALCLETEVEVNPALRNSEPKLTPVPINFASPHAASFQKKKQDRS